MWTSSLGTGGTSLEWRGLLEAGQRLRYRDHDRPPPSLATPYRTHTCGELRAADAGAEVRLAGWVHRRRDHGQLIFLDLRDRHGLTQVVIDKADAPDGARGGQPRPVRVRRSRFAATVALRLPGTENAKLPTGAIEVQATEVEILSEAKTPPFYINDPDAPDRRGDPAQVPLPRHPPRADAAAPAPAQPDGPGDPRGPPPPRVRRGRDADAHQEHAGRRPRLHRPEPAPAGQRLRPAAEPAAAQAAPDGRRHRPLLPDRPLLPRRGPARRPPAGVHPARPRDELRRRGDA